MTRALKASVNPQLYGISTCSTKTWSNKDNKINEEGNPETSAIILLLLLLQTHGRAAGLRTKAGLNSGSSRGTTNTDKLIRE